MTGFARSDGSVEECTWAWEAKSVNAKGLDVRCRIPSGFDSLEQKIREITQKRFQRGNISLNLQISWVRPSTVYQVNMQALQWVHDIMPELQSRFPDSAPPSIDGLLGIKGVVEAGDSQLNDDDRQAVEAALLADFDLLIDQLADVRAGEGEHLLAVINDQLQTISDLRQQAKSVASAQPEAIRKRLAEQVRELLDAVPALPEERLAQEAAVLMLKADVREELDRLNAHCEAARALLSDQGAVGRRLDFLCQEFNREANTVCSKSADIELSRTGLELKAVIEQMREQIQNVE
jgi:uncharacterized protein (TIGR00255 family)